MKPQMSPLSVLMYFLLTVLREGDTGNVVTCTCPKSVVEGESVILTCTYNQNMERNKKGFYIVRRQAGQDAVIVAICDWTESLDCNIQPGYNVTVQGNNVRLEISSVQLEHAGSYDCNTLPANKTVDINGCKLVVLKRENALSIACNIREDQASVACTFPKSLPFDNLVLEKHDFRGITKPVKIMQCYRDRDVCELRHKGYRLSNSSNTHNKSKGVILHEKDASKSGLYVCKTDADSSYYDMCTLSLDDGDHKLKEETESLTSLTAPLYAILGCMLLALIICLIFLIRRSFRKEVPRRSNTSLDSPRESRDEEEQCGMIAGHESGSADTARPNGHADGETPNG